MSGTPGSLARALGKLGCDKALPPVDQWQPSAEGHSGMQIDRDGDWFYQDSPIERPALVRLFSTVLRCDEGVYYLVTPDEKLLIEVADVPFIAVDIQTHHTTTTEQQCEHTDRTSPNAQSTSKALLLITNLGDSVPLDLDHPLTMVKDEQGESTPYIRVRGQLRARIHRNLFYHLIEQYAVEHTLEQKLHLGVWSGGEFFSLGQLPNE
ncbi:DUF1285 domain-containing protein [Aestuariirhabdus sp. Z084]|uniref:DUF1285 domain-containing protein n=1 Tax=Aestuariirhabdus haliotis TaxID=2918751 RepID=UPI00201B3B53|nr:DUF1285 domain-containing protein [Aestuariirhabdus haliotis]MCL6414846.1 DUF1285 domain-containing protein [Aestuariirhabdus haliotis]MCL6418778.1 DUF1285 domain-containing protein [Aestuariirhabdus haliotis]